MSPPIAWSGPEELETVQRHGIKLLICIINDGGYGAEMHKFRAYGVDPMHATHDRGDIAQVARGFGLNGRDTRLLAAKNSRNRIPAGSPAQQPAPVAAHKADVWCPRLMAERNFIRYRPDRCALAKPPQLWLRSQVAGPNPI
jgi:Thiamine pyrophosphate enzyme, C-terminal TPP binding domain